jgi:multidrug efflux pump subunit AcrB
MWIVRLALRRPYTFTVMAILIVLMGIVTITRMTTDIFPKTLLHAWRIGRISFLTIPDRAC